jgi:hypothetical protein
MRRRSSDTVLANRKKQYFASYRFHVDIGLTAGHITRFAYPYTICMVYAVLHLTQWTRRSSEAHKAQPGQESARKRKVYYRNQT